MNPKHLLVASAAALLQFSVTTAGAAPIYWDGPSGGWDVVANWSSDVAGTTDPVAVPGSSDVATFNITGQNTVASTVSLNADQSAMGLSVITSGTVILQGGGTNRTLSLGASGVTTGTGATKLNIGSATAGQNVSVLLQGSQTWAFNGTNTLNNGMFVLNGVSLGVAGNHTLTLGGTSGTNVVSAVQGSISNGSGVLSLTLNGSSTNRWNLNGSNSYSGATLISGGALGISTASGLGTIAGGTTVSSGAALFFRNTGDVTYNAEPITIAGAGPSGSNRGAMRQVPAGNTTWTGTVTADTASGNVRIGADNGTLTFSNTANITALGTGTIEFETAGAITVNGSISGSVGVTKATSNGMGITAANILALGGTNTYTGQTRVNIGILSLSGSLSNTSAVQVESGATLRGSGSINTAALTTVNGTIGGGAAFDSIGTLSLGSLTLGSSGSVLVDFDSIGGTADRLNVTGNLTLDAGNATALMLKDIAGTPSALAIGTAFTLIDYSGTWNGGLFSVSGNPISDDIETFTFGLNTYTIDYNGGASGNDVQLIVAVPEPASAMTLLAGIGALALRGRRRQRV